MSRDNTAMKKKSFIKTGEPILANYNWQDAADGLGYVEFQLVKLFENDVVKYSLSSNPIQSSYLGDGGDHEGYRIIVTTGDPLVAAFTTTPFHYTRVIGGTALFTASAKFVNTSGNDRTWTLSGNLKLVSGVTETSLGTFTASKKTSSDLGVFVLSSFIDINDTIVKVGDSLKFELTLNNPGASSSNVIYLDVLKLNEDTQCDTKLMIPFRIDI
jgi:hypothetical protein